MTVPDFHRVAILGAGLMGHGIAVVHALGGSDVTLFDITEEALERAQTQIAAVLATLEDAGEIASDTAKAALARISGTTDLAAALERPDYIVEAIPEHPGIKKDMYERVAQLAPDHALLASNTSYLDIFPLLPAGLANRAFIVHWYTPPYIIDLVDVVPSPGAPDVLTDRLVSYLSGLGKTPVRLKKFVPGYLANRIQMAIECEIFRLLDDGIAEAADIDLAIREGLAMRLALLGQFGKMDYTGIKLILDSHNLGVYTPPTPPTASKALARMLAEGHGGVKDGKGFYDYSGKSAVELFAERDRAIMALKMFLKQNPL